MTNLFDRGPALAPVEHEAVAWVQKLVGGEMTQGEVEALRHWCGQSAAHAAALAEAKQVWHKAGAAGRAWQSGEGDLAAALDAFGRQRKVVNRRMMLAGGGAAAAALSFYGVIDPPLGLWPSLSEISADYRTGTGQQRDVTIAGDVAVRLNTQTSLALRPRGGTQDRVELVSGEAAFAAARAARSFAVIAAGGTTSTEGGRFGVRYGATDPNDRVIVTCFEGPVEVAHKTESAELAAGQRVHYDAAGLSPVDTIDLTAASDWQCGIVDFRGTPLVEAIDEINRYRSGRLILMSAALGQKQISGRFRIDQMDKVVLQIEQAFSARLRRLPGGIVLVG